MKPDEVQHIEVKKEDVRCSECGKKLFEGEVGDKPQAIKCPRCKTINRFERIT